MSGDIQVPIPVNEPVLPYTPGSPEKKDSRYSSSTAGRAASGRRVIHSERPVAEYTAVPDNLHSS